MVMRLFLRGGSHSICFFLYSVSLENNRFENGRISIFTSPSGNLQFISQEENLSKQVKISELMESFVHVSSPNKAKRPKCGTIKLGESMKRTKFEPQQFNWLTIQLYISSTNSLNTLFYLTSSLFQVVPFLWLRLVLESTAIFHIQNPRMLAATQCR